MSVKTIILDLDGPLLEGSQRHYQCYSDILNKYGYKPMPLAQYWEMKRNRATRVEQLAVSSATKIYDVFLREWLANIETKRYLNLDLLQPNVVDILSGWQASGKRLILATMRSNNENLIWQLNQLGISTFLDKIICVDVIKESDKSEKVKQALVAEPREFFWIGDTEIDIASAKQLNIKIAVVSNGLRTAAYLKKCRPNFICRDLRQLLKYVKF